MIGRVEGKQNQFQPLTLESSHVRIDYKRRHHWKLSKLYDQRKRDDGKHLCFTFTPSPFKGLTRKGIGYSLKYSGGRSSVKKVFVLILTRLTFVIIFAVYMNSKSERRQSLSSYDPFFPANNLHQCNDVAYSWKKHHPEGVFSSSSRQPYYAPNS